MQICTLTQTHNHASIPPLTFLQAGCPFGHPTNSIKAFFQKQLNNYVLFNHSKVVQLLESSTTYSSPKISVS